MTTPVDPVSETTPTQPADSSAPATTTGAAPISGVTTVSSMEELKLKAPIVYDKMMEGIANNIINEMRRRQEHIKEIMRQGRRDAGQS